MTHRPLDEKAPQSIAERLIGGIVAVIFGLGTILVLPVMLGPTLLVARELAPLWSDPVFWCWTLAMGTFFLVAGCKLGIFRVTDLLNVIWRTGESVDEEAREQAHIVVVGVVGSALITLLLVWLRA